MSQLPNGSIVLIGSTLGAAKAFSAISNATKAALTLASGHGLLANDPVVLASGWGNLDGVVTEVDSISGDTTVVIKFDTSDAGRFAPGAGAGTIRKISATTEITKVRDLSTSGGDQEFEEFQYLNADNKSKRPTVRAAVSYSIEVDDDPEAAGYVAAKEVSDVSGTAPLIIRLKNGKKIYGNGYWSVSSVPTMKVNSTMTNKIDVSLVAVPVRI